MIHYILVQNRAGKTRLAKWYTAYTEEEKTKLTSEVYRLLNSRDSKYTNFLEFRTHKIVYRRYVGLYFCMCVDTTDNELAVLEAIHSFVETLDSYFGNVCELDLVYYYYKVFLVLDEMFVGGEIMETSKPVILAQMEKMDMLP
ncbi:AP-2 complex subunit sigma [Pelomyxa schiedti]|nr:AP-2 complex subunit sigma [Pelomyxa schiedti]